MQEMQAVDNGHDPILLYILSIDLDLFVFIQTMQQMQAVNMTQYKSKSPVFSLGQRFNPPADRFQYQIFSCASIS